MGNQQFTFLARSDTNRQKQARSLKFWVKVEEILYYLCSENKRADQLCSYCTADLHLCFRLSILLVFSCIGSIATPRHQFTVCLYDLLAQHIFRERVIPGNFKDLF